MRLKEASGKELPTTGPTKGSDEPRLLLPSLSTLRAASGEDQEEADAMDG